MSECPIIVDFTRDVPLIGAATDDSGLFVFAAASESTRVALRAEADDLTERAGAEAANWLEDGRTLVFEDVVESAPRLEDAELQSRLLRAVWREISRSPELQAYLKSARRTASYVIPPRNYSPALLEHWRNACAQDRACKIAGFVNETASLMLGFLQSEFFKQAIAETDASALATVSLIMVESDAVEMLCFDYTARPAGRRRAMILDHFRGDHDSFPARLRSTNWLNRLSLLVSLESPELGDRSKEIFAAVSGMIDANITNRIFQTRDLHLFRLRGAAHIARCSIGRGDLDGEYLIETGYNLGLRVNQQQMYPILRKEDSMWIDYPHTAVKTFRLRGSPGNEWRLSLYCGYSESVSECQLLGYCTLKQPELKYLAASDKSLLAACVRFDAPGAGELSLGLLPDDRIIHRLPFTLPGMVV